MTQEIISEEQKASLKMLSAKYDTEYIKFKNGEERVLQFNPSGWKEGVSDKYGTQQVTFDVIDPENPFAVHKLTLSSKRAIKAISDYMLDGQNLLSLKRNGEGNSTKWIVNPA
jgi:hypothetical protein